MTHHDAKRFRAGESGVKRQILYTHCVENGKRVPINLSKYPNAKDYLERHRERLEGRKYVLDAGRKWYEIWVPHDPEGWKRPKVVFRDICEHPVFWIDLSGAVVNGDCYWLNAACRANEPLLWLTLGVGNSRFIEDYYDKRFNNKLYAGRRRFMTQYVDQFPLPDPDGDAAKAIVQCTRAIYQEIGNKVESGKEEELNMLVYKAFGL